MPQPAPAPVAPAKKSRLILVIAAVAACVVLAGGAAAYFLLHAPSSEKVYHVGIVSALAYFDPAIDGFKKKMTDLGYVEGKNITYEIERGENPVGNQALVKKLVDNHVDLIVAYPTEASLEVKEGTKESKTPVISLAASVEGTGLIDSVEHPGGNLTGVRFPIPEVAQKRLDILHQVAPKAKRVLVPYLKDYPTVAIGLASIRDQAKADDITLIEGPFATPGEVAAYLSAQEKSPEFDAILTIPEPLSILPPFIDPFYAFADAHKIPIAGAEVHQDATGPLFSVIPSAFDFGQFAAPLADKIFKGTDPGLIPIVTPDSVFSINYKVAQRIGLTLSEDLLSTANVIVH